MPILTFGESPRQVTRKQIVLASLIYGLALGFVAGFVRTAYGK